MKQAIGGCLLASVLWLAGLPQSQAQTVPRVWEQWLATASARHPQWSGPRSGPRAVTGVTVAVISEDLRNGGILGVTKGIREAAGAIGWARACTTRAARRPAAPAPWPRRSRSSPAASSWSGSMPARCSPNCSRS